MAVKLVNEYGMLDAITAIVSMLNEIFAELPAVVERLKEDTTALDGLERQAIVIVSTLDSKGPETWYVRKIIEDLGHKVISIDGSSLDEHDYQAEYTNADVAKRAETTITTKTVLKVL